MHAQHAAFTLIARSGSRPRGRRARRHAGGRALLALLALAILQPAAADVYPTRPVRVIVPFSPGGAVDGPMRLIAQQLSKRLGQAVFVENKPGAGATIGSEIVAKAPADGYTLLLASQTNAISATLYPHLAFDPVEDFAPISLIGREPGVVVVNPALPVKTLQEFIAYARQRPGTDRLRLVGQRQRSASVRRDALLDDRHQAEPCSLPRQRPGDQRSARRPGVDVDSGPGQHAWPHQRRQAPRTRGHRRRTRSAATRRADGRRSGRAGICRVCVDGPAGAEGHAGRYRREAPPGGRASAGRGRGEALHGERSIEAVGSTPAEFGAFFRDERERWARIIRETGAKID